LSLAYLILLWTQINSLTRPVGWAHCGPLSSRRHPCWTVWRVTLSTNCPVPSPTPHFDLVFDWFWCIASGGSTIIWLLSLVGSSLSVAKDVPQP
jgi:hypothetical protein